MKYWASAMPLQNRVSPFGELFADPARGLSMGNRGGRFHTIERTLSARRWVSRAWICCRLHFNNRHRQVWKTGYTELFFLDEATALAAGHRPCFECRRKDAEAFAQYWQRAFALAERPRAAEMNRLLQGERLDGREQRRHRRTIDDLPDGTFVAIEDHAFAVKGNSLLRWTPAGYDACRERATGTTIDLLTPPAILAVLRAGYPPAWHPSAERVGGVS
jgi:hypothetical protein